MVLGRSHNANSCIGLEPDLRLYLNHPGGDVCVESRSENTRRGLLLIENLAEGLIGRPVIGKSKVGMVEKIEKLKTDSEHTAFPMGNVCVFHNGEVCRDVVRSAKTVPALRKGHARTAAGTIRTGQISSVESCFATCLHKQSARIR